MINKLLMMLKIFFSTLSRRNIIITASSLLVICIFILLYIFMLKPALAVVKIEYTIKPNTIDKKTVSVNIRIDRNGIFGPKYVYMGKNSISPIDTKCVDSTGKTVLFREADDKLTIGPINGAASFVDFSYSVNISSLGGTDYQGVFYDDEIAFSGENALYFPYLNYSDGSYDKIGKVVSKITVMSVVKSGFNSIMPYQDKFNVWQNEPLMINNPDWKVIYNLSKSCYAFGKFDEANIKIGNNNLKIYLDPAYKAKLSDEQINVITRLYGYYQSVFGGQLQNYPIVILRNNPSSSAISFAGVGGDH